MIIKDTLHPENQPADDLYPTTSMDMVVGLYDALGSFLTITDYSADMQNYYTKSEVDSNFLTITDYSANIQNYYNKPETENLIDSKIDSKIVNYSKKLYRNVVSVSWGDTGTVFSFTFCSTDSVIQGSTPNLTAANIMNALGGSGVYISCSGYESIHSVPVTHMAINPVGGSVVFLLTNIYSNDVRVPANQCSISVQSVLLN